MRMAKQRLLAAAAMVMTGALVAVPADAATFLFNFSGASFGNTATASGQFDIADSALTAVGANVNPSYGLISNLTMTVSGAGAGNGVFTTGNFVTMFFRAPGTLDFSRQLVGQQLTGGTVFGQAGQAGLAGDFTFFSLAPHTPTAFTTFTLGADRGLGAKMALTSLVATTAVPEPAAWAMLIVGLGVVGFALRRHRATVRPATAG